MNGVPAILMGIFLPVLMICVFTFVSITVWADARRREREAFYRSEALKKVAESPGGVVTAALEMMREQERNDRRRRRESQKLGGLIVAAVGLGLIAFLTLVDPRHPSYAIGFIPLLVGVALLGFAFLAGDRE